MAKARIPRPRNFPYEVSTSLDLLRTLRVQNARTPALTPFWSPEIRSPNRLKRASRQRAIRCASRAKEFARALHSSLGQLQFLRKPAARKPTMLLTKCTLLRCRIADMVLRHSTALFARCNDRRVRGVLAFRGRACDSWRECRQLRGSVVSYAGQSSVTRVSRPLRGSVVRYGGEGGRDGVGRRALSGRV